MKKGDIIILEDIKKSSRFNVRVREETPIGIYGRVVDNPLNLPWLDNEFFFNTASNGYYKVIEPVEIKPVYLEDGVMKFNTSSLTNKVLGDCVPSYQSDAIVEDGNWGHTGYQFVLKNAKADDLQDILNEFNQAYDKYGDFASFHEGYAVLQEEMDEFWEHVKTKEKNRDMVAMRKEVIQVAAMALKNLTLFHKVKS